MADFIIIHMCCGDDEFLADALVCADAIIADANTTDECNQLDNGCTCKSCTHQINEALGFI